MKGICITLQKTMLVLMPSAPHLTLHDFYQLIYDLKSLHCRLMKICHVCFQIEDTLERADFTLMVELWFTDQTFGPDQHSSISCVSSRTLQLHFSPTRGLHYHLPVLFDYFHLAAVTMTIHASLVALHQPYIK